MRSNKLVKTAIWLTLIALISKLFGFVREIALSYTYGATALGDVYLISQSIPNVIFGATGAALATTFIPLFCEVDKDKGEEESLRFGNNIFNIVIVITTILAILGLLFTEPLVKMFAMDFSGEKLDLAVQFTKIMIFSVVFIGINNILTSWLQIKDNFIIPGTLGFIYNLVLIGFIFMSSKGNVYLLAVGTFVAIAVQTIYLYPFARKSGYKYKPYINLKDEYLKKMLILVVPIFLGSLLSQLNFMIDRSLASTFDDGMIVILNNGSKLTLIINGLIIGGISTVLYPTLSRLSQEENKDNFVNIVVRSLNTITILMIPITVGGIVLAKPIIKLLFERGAFDSNASSMTAIAFSLYALGIAAIALNDILIKVFYSLKDTKAPMINGVITVILNIVLNIVLSKTMGYTGLALATSISANLGVVMMFIRLNKKIGYFGQDKIIITLLKSIVAASIMGIVTYLSYNYIPMIGSGIIGEAIKLMISVGLGTIVYGLVAIVLKIDEVRYILKLNKKTLK